MARKRRAQPSDASLRATLADLTYEELVRVLPRLKPSQARSLVSRWALWAQAGQVEPPGDWRVWMIRAGRGFGKTRAGAEWVSGYVRAHPGARIALVGHTLDDVRRVMIEGESGLIAVARHDERLTWAPSVGTLTFANKATATMFTAEAPDKLRGPQHDIAWVDELAKWRAGPGKLAWDNLMMGLRGGKHPRVLVTTTPRRTALVARVMATLGYVETRGRTRDNMALPDSFIAAMLAEYGDSVLGRQELDGELIEDRTGALWRRPLLEGLRVRDHPPLVRVVVGVDPPAGETGDACGIVAAGLSADGTGYWARPRAWRSAIMTQAATIRPACSAPSGRARGRARAGSSCRRCSTPVLHWRWRAMRWRGRMPRASGGGWRSTGAASRWRRARGCGSRARRGCGGWRAGRSRRWCCGSSWRAWRGRARRW